jgi:uncharacterized repeat protein (TIGR01451 family)
MKPDAFGCRTIDTNQCLHTVRFSLQRKTNFLNSINYMNPSIHRRNMYLATFTLMMLSFCIPNFVWAQRVQPIANPAILANSIRNCAEVVESGTTDPDSQPNNFKDPVTGAEISDQDDDDCVNVVRIYDLALIKTLAAGQTSEANAGANVIYTITVKNQGALNSGAFKVTDQIPGGMSYVSATGTNFGCTEAAGVVTCTYANTGINPGETAAITLTLKLNDESKGPFRNNAEISEDSGDDIDSTPDTNVGSDAAAGTGTPPNDAVVNHNDINHDATATDPADQDDQDFEDITVKPKYDLALIKKLASGQSSMVTAGSTVDYEITVKNQGNVGSGAFTVSDQIPAGMTYVTATGTGFACSQSSGVVNCNFSPDLSPGNTALITLRLQVADVTMSPFRNWAEISLDSGDDIDSTPDTNIGTDPGAGTGANPNDAVKNHNNIDNDATVSDPMDEDDNDYEDVSATPRYDLALVKTLAVGQASTVAPGATVNYVITVKNQGNVNSDVFTVTEQVPAGMTFVSANGTQFNCSNAAGLVTCNYTGSLVPQQETTINLALQITDVTKAPFRNNAEISADSGADVDSTPDTNTGNDTAAGTGTAPNDPVVNHNDINHDATVTDPADEDDQDFEDIQVNTIYDLALVKRLGAGQSSSVQRGSNVKFTITVTNQGNVPASNIQVTDYIPANMTLNAALSTGWTAAGANATYTIAGPIAPAGTFSMDIVLTVGNAATAGNLVNFAEISNDDGTDIDSTPDTTPGNDVGGVPGTPTDNVIDQVPPVDEDDHDPELVTVQIYDLALIKTLAAGQATVVTVGSTVDFVITTKNQGTLPSGAFTVTDQIPAGMTYVSATGTGFTCSQAAGVVNCNYGGSLTTGQTATITLRVTVADVTQTPFRNNAEISADSGDDVDSTPDTNVGNDNGAGTGTAPNDLVKNHNNIDNDATATDPADEDDQDYEEVSATPMYDLALVKKLSAGQAATVAPGATVSFDIVVKNQGNVNSGAFTVTEQIPSGMTFVSASGPNFNCTNVAGLVTCNFTGDLTPGQTALINLTAQVTDATKAPFRNNAEISADSGADKDSTPDTNTGNDTATGTGTPPNDAVVNHNDIDHDATTPDPADEDDQDFEDIQVNTIYDLALVKRLGAGQTANVQRGSNVKFTITVTNQGNVPASNIQVTDYIPANMTLNAALSTGWTAAGANATYTIAGPIAPAGTFSMDIVLTVSNAATAGNLVNFAEISNDDGTDIDSTPDTTPGNDVGGVPGTPTDNVIDQVPPVDEDDHDPELVTVQIYDLALIKTLAAGQSAMVTVGSTVDFVITTKNQGTLPSGAFTVTDQIPAGMTYVSATGTGFTCSQAAGVVNCNYGGNLTTGQTATITLRVTVADVTQTPFRNWAEISADSGDDVDSTPDTNTGTDPSAGTGTAPNDLVKNHNNIDNDATATDPADEDDNDYEDVSATPMYDLALVKKLSAGQAATVAPGATVSFDIVVKNQGNVNSGTFTVTEQIPSGMTFVSASGPNFNCTNAAGVVTCNFTGDLTPGQTALITLTSQITDALKAPFRNNAEISADSGTDKDSTPDTNTGNDTGTGTGTPPNDAVVNHNDIDHDATTPDPADEDDQDFEDIQVNAIYDLALVKRLGAGQTANVQRGSNVKFTITVTNQGNVPASNIQVTDYIPANMTLNAALSTGWTAAGANATYTIAGPIAPAGTFSMDIVLTVSNAAAAGSLVNFAEISNDDGTDIDSTPDTTPGNDTGGVPGTPTDNVIDQKPPVDEDDHDPELVTVQIYDLALIKTLAAGQSAMVTVGSTVDFVITAKNQGTLPSGAFTVTDQIPAGMTYVSATGTGFTCSQAAGVVNCNYGGNLTTGQTATITLRVTVADVTQTPFRNNAEISADSGDDVDSTPDTNVGNDNGAGTGTAPNDLMKNHNNIDNDATAPDPMDEDDQDYEDVSATPMYDLALVKKLAAGQAPAVNPGSTVNYDIVIKNQGNVNSGTFTVTDQLPGGMAFVSGTGANFNCSNASGLVTCNFTGSLTPGQSTTLALAVQIVDANKGPFRNWAEISADSGDDKDSTPDANTGTDPTSGTGTNPNDPSVNHNDIDHDSTTPDPADEDDNDFEDIQVNTRYDLALVKTLSTGQANAVLPGANVSFTITVKNQGNINSGAFTVTEQIPAGMTFVSATGTNFTCTNAAGVVSCNFTGDLAPDAGALLTVVATLTDPAQAPFRNWAEISADSGPDEDSTPDSNTGSDPTSGTGILPNDPVVNHNDINHDATTTDPADEDDNDYEEIQVITRYDLALIKTVVSPADQILRALNDQATFHITVKNQGNVNSGAFTVRDQIPVGLSFVSATGAGFTCSNAGQVLGCNYAATGLSPNATATIDVVVRFTDSALDANGLPATNKNYRNWAEISADSGDDVDSTPDTNTGNDPVRGYGSIPNDKVRNHNNIDNDATSVDTSDEDDNDYEDLRTILGNPDPDNPINQLARINIVKVVDKAAAMPGDVLTYTLSISNTGSRAAYNVDVQDPNVAGLTGATYSIDGGATLAWPATGKISFANGVTKPDSIAVGGTVNITIRGTVPQSALGKILENVASVFTPNDPAGPKTTPPVKTCIGVPNLHIEKTVDKNTAIVGDVLVYTLKVTNDGNAPVTKLTISDANALALNNPTYQMTGDATKAAGTPWTGSISLTAADLVGGTFAANSDVITVTIRGTVPASFQGKVIDNIAKVSSPEDPQGEKPSTPTETAVGTPHIVITKSVDKTVAQIGQTLTYTIKVRNEGQSPATEVTVSDAVATLLQNPTYRTVGAEVTPAVAAGTAWTGAVTFRAANLAGGSLANSDEITIEITGTIAADKQGSVLQNIATASSPQDPTGQKTTPPVNTVVGAAKLVATKTVDKSAAQTGQTLTYVITVRNDGNANAQTITVNDATAASALTSPTYTVSAGTPASGAWNGSVTLSNVNLAPGASMNVTITGTIPTSAQSTVITNIANVSSPQDPAGPTATPPVQTSIGTAKLQATKSVNKTSAQVGDALSYTITVTNNGGANAQSVTVNDPVAASLTNPTFTASAGTPASGSWTTGNVTLTGVNLAPNASMTVTINGTVPAAWQGKVIDNVATVSSPQDPSGPVTTPVVKTAIGTAKLSAYKQVNRTVARFGDQVVYTITVRNDGSANATAVTINDAVAASALTGVTYTASTGTPASGTWTGSVTLTGLNLAPAQTLTLTITGTVPASAEGTTIINTANVSSPQDPTNVVETPPVQTDITKEEPKLDVSKRLATVTPNGNGTYNLAFQIYVTNNGDSGVSNFQVTDNLINAFYNTPNPILSMGNISGGALSFSGNGGTGTFNSTFTGTPAGSINLLTGGATLAKGGTALITFTVNNVKPSANAGYTNTATAQANTVSGRVVFAEDDEPIGFGIPMVGVDKTLISAIDNGNGTMDVIYEINAINTGTLALSNFQLTDDLRAAFPAPIAITPTATLTRATKGNVVMNTAYNGTGNNTLFNAGSTLDPGGQVTVRLAVRLSNMANATSFGPFVNNVRASGTDPNGTPASDTDAAPPVYGGRPKTDLKVWKTVDNANPGVGDNIRFTIGVVNLGKNNATNIKIQDVLPTGLTYQVSSTSKGSYDPTTGIWSIAALAVDESATLDMTVTMTTSQSVINTAILQSLDQEDTDATNNWGKVPIIPKQTADLHVTKVVDVTRPVVGQTVEFTVRVLNEGPAIATGVQMEDLLLPNMQYVSHTFSDPTDTYNQTTGIWNVGVINVGQTAEMKIRAQILSGPSVTNVASVAKADQPDPDPTDNTAIVTVNVGGPQVDLSVTETVNGQVQTTVNQNDIVNFMIMLTNQGPDGANNIKVQNLLPPGIEFVAGSGAPVTGTYDPTTGVWSIPSLAANASTVLKFQGKATEKGTVSPAVQITKLDEFDRNPANNFASVIVCTDCGSRIADLKIVKLVDNPLPTVGDEITFTIVLENGGPAIATNVEVTDLLPSGVTFVSSTSTTYNPAAGDYTWNIPTLGLGARTELRIKAKVTDMNPMVNFASVTKMDQRDDTQNVTSVTVTPRMPLQLTGADLRLQKAVSNTTPNTGDEVRFTLSLFNNGPEDAKTVVVRDILPAGFTFVSAIGTGTYDNATGLWNVGTVNYGVAATMEITAKANYQGYRINMAQVIGSDKVDPNPANNVAYVPVCASCAAIQPADLDVVKTVSNARPKVGDKITFSINIQNNGPNQATGVVVKDLLPPGLEYVANSAVITSNGTNAGGTYDGASWNIGRMLPTESMKLSLDAIVTSDRPTANFTCGAQSNMPDPTPGCSTVVITPQPSTGEADIVIRKTVDNVAPMQGGEVVFTIAVTNNGPSNATNLKVRDVLASGFTYVTDDDANSYNPNANDYIWNIGTLGVGQTRELKIRVRVTTAANTVNTAIVESMDQKDPGGPASDAVTVKPVGMMAGADVAVDIVSTPNPVQPNGTLKYCINVRNLGAVTATGVNFTTVLPVGVTFNPSSVTPATDWACSQAGQNVSCVYLQTSLAPGGVRQACFDVTVNASVPVGSNLFANVVVNAANDTNPTNNYDTETTIVGTPNPGADMTIAMQDAPDPVQPGGNLIYTYFVSNVGAQPGTGVSFTSNLPNGVTYVPNSVSSPDWACTANGQAVTCTYTGTSFPAQNTSVVSFNTTVSNSVPNGSALTNTTTVTATNDGNPANNATSAVTTVGTPPTGADVVIVKEGSVQTVNSPGSIRYYFSVHNIGLQAATSVNFVDQLPQGMSLIAGSVSPANEWNCAANGQAVTCTYIPGAIASNGSKVVYFEASVASGLASGQQLVNNVTVNAANDSNPLNNTARDIVTVGQVSTATLRITKDGPAQATANSTVTYTLTVQNTGNTAANNVQVRDSAVLTALTNVTYSTDGSNFSAWPSSGTIILPGVLDANQQRTVILKGTAPASGTISNIAYTSATGIPEQTSNTVTTTISSGGTGFDLVVGKTVSNPVPKGGDIIEYTIIVTNTGTQSATNVIVNDKLPSGLSYFNNNTPGESYTPSTGVWNVGTLAAGATRTLKLRAAVNANAIEPIVNTASVACGGSTTECVDANTGNNSGYAVISPVPCSSGNQGGVESNGDKIIALGNALFNWKNIEAQTTSLMTELFAKVGLPVFGPVEENASEVLGLETLLPSVGPENTTPVAAVPDAILRPGATNALGVSGQDYILNGRRIAAALVMQTASNQLYTHTKNSCDRLGGAILETVDTAIINGNKFILSKLHGADNMMDYAVTFVAYKTSNGYVIDSRYTLPEYQIPTGTNSVLNFQVWGTSPQYAQLMAEKTIQKLLQDGGRVSYLNTPTAVPNAPRVFISTGEYRDSKLVLKITNLVGASSFTVSGEVTRTEGGSKETKTWTVPLSSSQTVQTVEIPTGMFFDIRLDMTNSTTTDKDQIYMADGSWGYGDNSSTIGQFTVAAQTAYSNPVGYTRLERAATLKGTTNGQLGNNWVSLYRYFKPGWGRQYLDATVGGYDQIQFFAAGTGTVEVAMKKGSTDWSDLYRKTITLTPAGKQYRINFFEFARTAGGRMVANDLEAIVFYVKGTGTNREAFEINVKDLMFRNSVVPNEEGNSEIPASITLDQNYPNPFNPSTAIHFGLPQAGAVHLEVFDVLGRSIGVLANGAFEAGQHEVNFDAKDLPSGIYVYRLKVGNTVITKKMNLIK